MSFGKIIKEANKAADELAKEGIEAEVIDLRTVRPIDFDAILTSVRKTNRLVVLEEAWPLASISSEIAYKVQKDAFDDLDAPVKRVTCFRYSNGLCTYFGRGLLAKQRQGREGR